MSVLKQKIVVLSGAGISAESGLGTFRDSGGLWEKYEISKVATVEAWEVNPELVLEFYNARRAQVLKATPNEGHRALSKLAEHFDVKIITQNIDDLHERAGSTNVIHLHGQITKGRSVKNDQILYDVGPTIFLGDKAPDGGQMRPDVVWFGEAVPKMLDAEAEVRNCDILIVVGTSLNVYPAASLIFCCPEHTTKYIIDPKDVNVFDANFIHVKGLASNKLPELVEQLIQNSI